MIALECIIENTILMYSPFCDGGFGQRWKIISCRRGWSFLDRLLLPLVFLFLPDLPKSSLSSNSGHHQTRTEAQMLQDPDLRHSRDMKKKIFAIANFR